LPSSLKNSELSLIMKSSSFFTQNLHSHPPILQTSGWLMALSLKPKVGLLSRIEKNIYLLENSMAINTTFALCSAMQKQKFIKDQKQLMPTGASSMALNFLTKQSLSNGSRRNMALIVLNGLILLVLVFIAFMIFIIGKNLDERK